MKILGLNDAKWNSTAQSSLDCLVRFDDFSSAIPFTAVNNSDDDRIQLLWDEAIKGPVATFVGSTAVPVEIQHEEFIPEKDTNKGIFAQISALEAMQPRILRELALGRPEAKIRLQQIDIDITLLRSKLV